MSLRDFGIHSLVSFAEAAREAGDLDVAVLFAGEGVGLITDCPSAGDVVDRIISEAEYQVSEAVTREGIPESAFF